MRSYRLPLIILLAGLLIAIPFSAGSYLIYILNLTMVFFIACMGLNFISGYTGLISIAHAAFFAIGAYGSVILNQFDLSFWLAVPITAFMAFLIGFIVGLPALRLSGLYLAIATLAFGSIVERIIVLWKSVTGGLNGLPVTSPSFFSIQMNSDIALYFLILIVTLLMVFLAKNISNSSLGRSFLAVRESEISAEASGVNLAMTKTLSFGIGAFYAAVGGSLYAQLIGYINIESFSLWLSIKFLAMIIVGGVGTILGSLFGAIFFTLLPEALRGLEDIQTFIFGLSIMLAILFMPRGLAGIYHSLQKKWFTVGGQK